jgi:hypothetical protein
MVKMNPSNWQITKMVSTSKNEYHASQTEHLCNIYAPIIIKYWIRTMHIVQGGCCDIMPIITNCCREMSVEPTFECAIYHHVYFFRCCLFFIDEKNSNGISTRKIRKKIQS